jgi:DNA-binding NarL/FixJ family response regulator
VRIVIAEDSVLLREGLQLLLGEAGHDVVAAVGDGPTLVAAARSHRPDLCIVDVRMPPSHTDEGLRAVVEVRAQWSEARVIVLSQYVELSYAEDLLADGVGGIGYLLKDRVSDIEDFVESVERVAAGGTVIDPIVVSQLIARRRDPMVALTPREKQVLSLMAEGHSNAGIARAMTITEGAVEKYSARLFAKLGLLPDETGHRRVRAVLAWLQRG